MPKKKAMPAVPKPKGKMPMSEFLPPPPDFGGGKMPMMPMPKVTSGPKKVKK